MLAEMKKTPGLDEETLNQGRSMMEQGKRSIQQILSGLEREPVGKAGGADQRLREYTKALAAAMVNVAETLEKVKLEKTDQDAMTLHHFNLLMNQALGMASVGCNLILLGQRAMTRDLGRESVENGKEMLTSARSLVIQVMGSKAMRQMHGREAGKMPDMGSTHKLASVVLKVLDLLDELVPVQ
jgi:hypothetical protein